ncbi:MAG: penicillin-binding transpeptidase domain-containing protein [Deltaproteobacteria bacterium]|nr:penicillin-binding transpeptidase domain-containing protein [Deltaproteobacteria bacterium]
MRFRLRVAGGLLLVLLVTVALRAIQLQAFDGERLARMGERQHLQEWIVQPERGTIFGRGGDALAISIETQSVYVRPRRLKVTGKVVADVARALDMKRADVRRKMTAGEPFVWLKRQVTPREAQRVRRLKIEGIGFYHEPKRYYPQGRLAGQALGVVGRDAQGLEGVERSYDRYIRGESSSWVVERDALGRRMLVAGLDELKLQPGPDVHLTLDTALQHLAEKHLEATVRRYRAKGGTVVMADPYTGAIMALASYPFFDPNQYQTQDRSRWRIRGITDTYEPGSVFKAVLAAAALEDGVVGREDLIFCEYGKYRYGGRTIHDFKEYGWLSFAKVLELSSNIGVTKVADKLGKERYHRYIRRFGFGQKTGVDLLGEVEGRVRPHHEWYKVDLAAASFGQSIATTPLQMVMAFSAIANGGLLMRPYLVDRVVGEDGRVLFQNKPEMLRRVVSRETARTVVDMLKGVVAEGGTGFRAAVAGFETAGKTGTSQKADRVKGGYSEKRVASFAGFVPADEPRFVLLTLVDEPTVQVYGGLVAAPLFQRIAGPALHALGQKPDGRLLAATSPAGKVGVVRVSRTKTPRGKAGSGGPNLIGMSMRQAVDEARKLRLSVVLRGHGYVAAQRMDRGGRRLVLTLKE